MKKIITSLLLITLVTTTTVFAQTGVNDPEAKKVLDAVSAKFKTFKTVKANLWVTKQVRCI